MTISDTLFHDLTQTQISERKETFSMIDHDADGIISADDLRVTFNSLGDPLSEAAIQQMITDCYPGNITFPIFLKFIQNRFTHLQLRQNEFIRLFEALTESNSGKISIEEFRNIFSSNGDTKLSDQDISILLKGVPIDFNNTFNYMDFIQSLSM